MIATPTAVETEIAIAEHASERDLPDVRHRIERRRRGFQRRERARHFAGLMLEPFRLVSLRLAPARLVDGEDRGIENAVAQSLQAERRKPRLGIARHDLAAAGAVVEIIEDDAGIVIRGAVLVDHDRNLAERILLADAVVDVGGVGGFDFHIVVEAENGNCDPDLAAERRRRRRAQNHHCSTFDVTDFVCGSAFLRQCIARRNATDQRSAGRPHGISLRVALPHDAAPPPYPVTTRLTAFGPLPFLSGSTSKLMRWPSTSDFSPARSTAVMCTNTSRPPSSGLMKP